MKQSSLQPSGILVVLCGLLCAFLLPQLPRSQANETVYFTAINDNILPLSKASMPAWINGQLYVPYTVFSPTHTGINLGVNSAQNRSSGTVTVYSQGVTLLFDMNAGTCVDQKQTDYPYRAVTRNNIAYLPVAGVCNFFGLTYSYTNTDYGYLLRLKNALVVLSDVRFIDAASTVMNSMLRDYLQSEVTTPTSPSTPSTPAPSTPSPTTPSAPEEEPLQETDTPLAFGLVMADQGDPLHTVFDQQGIKAVFFFTGPQLKTQGDLLRTLLGSGHRIGLQVTATTLEGALEELSASRLLLAQQTWSDTLLIQGAGDLAQSLETQGYCNWPETDLLDLSSPSTQVANLPLQGNPLLLTLSQGESSQSQLTQFLALLLQQSCTPLMPTEQLC